MLKTASLNYNLQGARWSYRPRDSSCRLLKRFCSSMMMIQFAVVFKFIVSVAAQAWHTDQLTSDGFTFKATMIPRSYARRMFHLNGLIKLPWPWAPLKPKCSRCLNNVFYLLITSNIFTLLSFLLLSLENHDKSYLQPFIWNISLKPSPLLRDSTSVTRNQKCKLL